MDAERSLCGLWAHFLDADGLIERQVQILRPGPPGTWIVQNYSWIDGQATTVSVVSQGRLITEEKCVLYLDREAMIFAYEYGSLGHQTRAGRTTV